MEAIAKGAASAIIAYTSHYGVAKLYNYACVPDGIWGFFQGMISAGSPVCQAGMQALSTTQVTYSSLILMGITRVGLDLLFPGAK
jgi:multisubunit Na+/H+ antiporter MnhB subunit